MSSIKLEAMEVEEEPLELPPGFRFHPTDEEIITQYLMKKAMSENFQARAIGEADLNRSEPWDLPGEISKFLLLLFFISYFFFPFFLLKGRRRWGRRSGTSSVGGRGGILRGWGRIGLQMLDTGRPQERIRKSTKEIVALWGWRKP